MSVLSGALRRSSGRRAGSGRLAVPFGRASASRPSEFGSVAPECSPAASLADPTCPPPARSADARLGAT